MGGGGCGNGKADELTKGDWQWPRGDGRLPLIRGLAGCVMDGREGGSGAMGGRWRLMEVGFGIGMVQVPSCDEAGCGGEKVEERA